MYHTGVCSCAGMRMSGPDTGAGQRQHSCHCSSCDGDDGRDDDSIRRADDPDVCHGESKTRRARAPLRFDRNFVLGYLVVWTLFSAFAALMQWVLHAKALLSPLMVSTSPILGGVLLITTGVFQWTPLKNSSPICLALFCHEKIRATGNGLLNSSAASIEKLLL